MNKVNDKELFNILIAPIVTEKNSRLAAERKYVFRVLDTATKTEIKKAVQALFNVAVESVRVCNIKGKVKNFGKISGQRRSWKKAYVMLKPENEIKFAGA